MGSQQTNDTMTKVKNAFQKAGATISRSSGVKQLAIGSASGCQIMDKKRNRCANFLNEETTLLIDLAINYKEIIENKKTDAVIWKDKEEIWERISKEFNSENLINVPRSAKTLRLKYEGLKKNLRKKILDHKKQQFVAGDVPHTPIVIEDHEEKLLQSIDGLTPIGCDISISKLRSVKLQLQQASSLQPPAEEVSLASKSATATANKSSLNKELPAQIWSTHLKRRPDSRLRINNKKRPCVEMPNAHYRNLAEEKIKLVKREMECLENEEIRKLKIYEKTIQNLEIEDSRRAEKHKIEMEILKEKLKNNTYL